MAKHFLVLVFLWVNYAFAQTPAAMFAASPAHTGVYSASNHTLGNVKWKLKTSGKIFSSPAVYKGKVYFGSEDHNLYATDENTGKLLWKFATGGAVHSSPAVYKDVVYFGSYDGYYYALNALTGKQLWKFKTAGEKKVGAKGLWTMKPYDKYMDDLYDFFLSSPVLNLDDKDLTVYFGSSDGNLYALDAATGKHKWAFKTGGLIHTTPVLYDGKLYFGSWDRFLYALDAKTGKLQWKFQTGKQEVYHVLEGMQASPTCADGIVYCGSRDGFFYAFDATAGKMLWKYDAGGSWVLTTAAVQHGVVYIGTSDTYLFLGLDAKSGKEKLRYKTNGYVYSSPAIAGNTAYFGDFTGSLNAVDLNTGKLTGRFTTPSRNKNAAAVLNKGNIDFNYAIKGKDLSLYSSSVYGMNRLYTLGSIVSSPAIHNNAIFFGSADGYLYVLNLK